MQRGSSKRYYQAPWACVSHRAVGAAREPRNRCCLRGHLVQMARVVCPGGLVRKVYPRRSRFFFSSLSRHTPPPDLASLINTRPLSDVAMPAPLRARPGCFRVPGSHTPPLDERYATHSLRQGRTLSSTPPIGSGPSSHNSSSSINSFGWPARSWPSREICETCSHFPLRLLVQSEPASCPFPPSPSTLLSLSPLPLSLLDPSRSRLVSDRILATHHDAPDFPFQRVASSVTRRKSLYFPAFHQRYLISR